MKMFALVPLFASLLALASGARTEDRTITQVVKLLQSMLDKSKQEADDERTLFAKFKCYCDKNDEEKTTSIADLTKEIGLLENEIESLQGVNGKLAIETAKLQQEMDANEAAQEEAVAMRKKAKEDFEATETDLEAAGEQMGLAIDTLSAIGADQSLQASAEHDKFLAGYKPSALVKLQATVQKALVDANAFLTPEQRRKYESLLQVPFTGTYSAQSGGIVGILKSMKETFKSNLESAQAAEAAQVEAHEKFMETEQSTFKKLKESFDKKQGTMSGNDATLGTKTSSLGSAKQQLEDDEEFLAELTEMCKEKASDFEKRKMFAANEEAAISKAIAILNSDKAFEAFGKVGATKDGATGAAAFVQIRDHTAKRASDREELVQFLRHAAVVSKSDKVAKVASLVAKMNPFTVIINEINKMLTLIDKEAKADAENKAWCETEREDNGDNLDLKKGSITELKQRIDELDTDIDDPEVGLKVSIIAKETAISENYQQQQDETKTRREENQVYQENVGNCDEAATLLTEAIAVLQKYYAALDSQLSAGESLLQKKSPTPPDAEFNMEGQSEKGGSAVAMLEFILSETQAEMKTAHDDESEAQQAYEDSMTTLTKDETDLQDALVNLQEDLAKAKEELLGKHSDLKTTEKDKAAIEKYLLEIKPGCDFIAANFDMREQNRATETTALNTAETKIKGTPAYTKAAAEDAAKGFGAVCEETCTANEAHAKCQACLAKVSIPGYCAGHPGTEGC
mmetsp:Transcript_35020/g.104048  ORF Transcript_35020/g.104048 Transcript_35020/m.104048 type:complete len:744 (-) Transcript_35020:72-2303(-)